MTGALLTYPFEVGDDPERPCPTDGALLHRVDVEPKRYRYGRRPKYAECTGCGARVEVGSNEVVLTG